MVPPYLSKHVPAVDTDFLTFINEFLFNPLPQVSSARSTLRHQRTPPRHKRYRSMWRAAATSLMKKRYSSQGTHLPFADRLLRELPSIDNGQSSKETYLSIADHLHRNLPSQVSLNNADFSQLTPLPSADEPPGKLPLGVSLDEGHFSQATHLSSADPPLRKLPSSVFLDDEHSSQGTNSLPSQDSFDYGGGLATIDSQHHPHDRIAVDAVEETPLLTPTCSKSIIKGSTSGLCSKALSLEAASPPAVPRHSSRKPPRPPRAIVSRSGSNRAIRFKTATRRAMVENARMRKQKLPKSTSNATSVWALIITLCFASIMLVQGFLGNNSKDLSSKVEGQPIGEGVSSVSPYLGVPPVASGSSTQTLVADNGAGTSLAKLQKAPRDLPFMNLQRHRLRRLGATSWLLI